MSELRVAFYGDDFTGSVDALLQFARRGWSVAVIEARTAPEVMPALRQAEALVNARGLYAAGFVSYEAAPGFDSALEVRTDSGEFPLLWFGLYEQPEVVAAPTGGTPLAGEWAPSVSREAYAAAIDCVKDHIARGDVYEVNYTQRLEGNCANALDLYARLRESAPVPYNLYLDAGGWQLVGRTPFKAFALERSEPFLVKAGDAVKA